MRTEKCCLRRTHSKAGRHQGTSLPVSWDTFIWLIFEVSIDVFFAAFDIQQSCAFHSVTVELKIKMASKSWNKLYRTMMWHHQMEACTNAETHLQWEVFKTVREKTVQNSLQARSPSERLFSTTASHVSDEKRKGEWCWCCMVNEIAKWPQTNSK